MIRNACKKSRKWIRKILKGMGICCYMIVMMCFLLTNIMMIINKVMEHSAKEQQYYIRGIEIIPEAEYIVVPGAQIYVNAPGLYLQHRLNTAYQLYKTKKAPKIIVSGGFDTVCGMYETEVMYAYLVKLGVDEKDIIIDTKGNNTYATIKRVKDYVGDRKKVIFCTQEIYSSRAVYLAKHLGLSMNVLCSDEVIYMQRGRTIFREYFARVKAVLNCTIFLPKVDAVKKKGMWM